MKKITYILFLMVIIQGYAQKQFTKTGTIDFEASVPAFEPVKASNNTVTAILDTSTGEIAVLALMKGFRFRNALMEEHFNENYMESDTYPKAVFKGNIKDFSIINFEDGNAQTFDAIGTLELHGKSKIINIKLIISGDSKALQIKTKFDVSPEDFDIEIPSVVSEKISDKIHINVMLALQEK